MRAKKQFGQHFLTAPHIAKGMASAARVTKDENVLEIGPGLGALTLELAKRAKRVVAVEKDKNMAEILKELLKCSNVGNVEVVHGDQVRIALTPASTALTMFW